MKRGFSLVFVVAMIQLVCVSRSFADPIHDAARAGIFAEVTRLIAEGRANLEARDRTGSTPLHLAAYYGHTATVQALIAAGSNVDATNQWDSTPLHYAAYLGHTAIVQAFIAQGANVNARSQFGRTPLQEAQLFLRDTIVAALQPNAIAQVHTQTALSHAAAGNHELAARSHTWAAEAIAGTITKRINQTRSTERFRTESAAVFHCLRFFFCFSSSIPSTDAARGSYTRAAESFTLASDYGAAARSFVLAGNHVLAAESHTQHAHAQVAALDYASAVAAHHLAHTAHTALGNHEAAGLSHRFATLLAPAVPVKEHLASAHEHSQAMETHFETAVTTAGEIKLHRDRFDEVSALSAEAQVGKSLESADRSAAEAISALEAANVALEEALVGVKRAREERAQVADAPAAHLAQHDATVDSLRAHMESVFSKIDETHASAAAGRERVSAARGI